MKDLIKHLEYILKLQDTMFKKMWPDKLFPHDVICNRAGINKP